MVVLLEGSQNSTEELWCSGRVTIRFFVISLTKALLLLGIIYMVATVFLGTCNDA